MAEKSSEGIVPKNRFEKLAVDVSEHPAFYKTLQDSQAYLSASKTISEFITRGLDAARRATKELDAQAVLPQDDPKKMSTKALQNYQDMISEVEVWALTLPPLLQSARTAQMDPEVRRKLWDIVLMSDQRTKVIDAQMALRMTAFKFSTENAVPDPAHAALSKDLQELATIATVGWMIRNKLEAHPAIRGDAAFMQAFRSAQQVLKQEEFEHEWKNTKDGMNIRDFLLEQEEIQRVYTEPGTNKIRKDDVGHLFATGRIAINGVVISDPTALVPREATVELISTYHVQTRRVGNAINTSSKTVADRRKEQAGDRGTQGLPGAEKIAFMPALSFSIWKQLLSDTDPKQRSRYARQLDTGVQTYRKDFLEGGQFREFEAAAKRALDEVKGDAAKAKKWFKIFQWMLGDERSKPIVDRAVTPFEEFEGVYEKVMAEMKKGFAEIATDEHRTVCNRLSTLLADLGSGKPVDQSDLQNAVDDYAKLYAQTGSTLLRLQVWQIAQNVGRVGGTGDANMLEQITREKDGNRAVSTIERFAPYGAFSTHLYRDEQGRLQFVDTLPPASERGFLYHAKEQGKFVLPLVAGTGTAVLTRVSAGIMSKIPGLGSASIVSRILGPLAIPIASEIELAELKGAANVGVTGLLKQDVDTFVTLIQSLQSNSTITIKERISRARPFAQKLQQLIYGFIAASHREGDLKQLWHGTSDLDRRPDWLLESQLYTNELLTAMGYPPLASVDPALLPTSEQDLDARLKKMNINNAKISPEIRQYFALRTSEHEEAVGAIRGKFAEINAEKNNKVIDFVRGAYWPEDQDVSEQLNFLQNAKQSRLIDTEFANVESDPAKQEHLKSVAREVYRFMTRLTQEKRAAVHGFSLKGILSPFSRPQDPGDARGKIERKVLSELNGMARKIDGIPPLDILLASRYLEKHPPTAADMQQWAPGSVRSAWTPDMLGQTGSRFLQIWAETRQYIDKYAPPERTYTLKDASLKNTASGQTYTTEYSEDDGTPIPLTVTYENVRKKSGNAATKTSEKSVSMHVSLDGPPPSGWGPGPWIIDDHKFFKDERLPKPLRDHLLSVITRPLASENGRVTPDHANVSLQGIAKLFINDPVLCKTFVDLIQPMYLESYEKQMFLQQLHASITVDHGGKITKDTIPKIILYVQQAQERGYFGRSVNRKR